MENAHSRQQRDVHLRILIVVISVLLSGFPISTVRAQSPAQTSAPVVALTPLQQEEQELKNQKLSLEIHKLEEEQKLNSLKLQLETDKLRLDNENSRRDLSKSGLVNFLYANGGFVVALVGALGTGIWGFYTYVREKRKEREQREKESFEAVVKGLGSEQEQERIGSAVLLSTFLQPRYKNNYYNQVFNLAAGNLRQRPGDAQGSLRQMSASVQLALGAVLREAYPLAREQLQPDAWNNIQEEIRRRLNGEGVHLDGMYFGRADLKDGWFRKASLKHAALVSARLHGANLEDSVFSGADLREADLSNANLKGAKFDGANLRAATFSGGRADNAVFESAILEKASFDGITLSGANMTNANLSSAVLTNIDFSSPDPESPIANPERAKNLQGTVFRNVQGLSNEQIAACREKGARFLPE